MKNENTHNSECLNTPQSEKNLDEVLNNLQGFLDRFNKIELDPIFNTK